MVDYCTLEQIKSRLKDIEITDTEYDVELKDIRDDKEAYIDMRLKAAGTSTPLSATNDVIANICADLCAAEFFRRRAPASETNPFEASAIGNLDAYVGAESDIAFIVGEDTS